MTPTRVLLDTGPLVAYLNRRESVHPWALQQFRELSPPLLTCEAVITESFYLLRKVDGAQARIFEMLERGVLSIGMNLSEEAGAVAGLFRRYDNVPASLADACLIRMSELHEPCAVLTLDSDFHVYRRHGRRTIPLIRPAPESR